MVSVIIPCYNYARFLPEAVASVAAQTDDDWELIIVDDGSSDDSVATAQRLINGYPERRARLFQQRNSGLAAARNTGAQQARGDMLVFLDADDLLAPTFIAQTVAAMRQHHAVGFVYSGMQLFGHDSVYIPSVPFDLPTLLRTNILLAQSLVRRAAWAQVGGFDSVHFARGHEDWDFWVRLAAAGWRGWHIAAPLVYYRRHGQSMSAHLDSASEWDMRAQIIRKHPRLYGARLAAWATTRCARRGLPGGAQLAPAVPVRAISATPEVGALRPRFAPPPLVRARLPIQRRLIRAVPYRLRFRLKCWVRGAQLALRATGLWA